MSDNQVIERLLSAGGGEALAFAGFLSTARDERIRLYQAFSTEAYIELYRKDILHIEEPEKDIEESIVFVNSDTNFRVVFERELNVKDIKMEPERWPAKQPPEQPSSKELSASSAGGLTACAGGLVIVLCAYPAFNGPNDPKIWKYKLGHVHLSCGPSMTLALLC